MAQHSSPSLRRQETVAALAAPARMESLGPVGSRFVQSLRLIALHQRLGRDPVPELAIRLGGVEVAAKSLYLSHVIASVWPEKIQVSRFCCPLLSHDELTIGNVVDAAAGARRDCFEDALAGLVRADRMHRVWEASLALSAAELRAA